MGELGGVVTEAGENLSFISKSEIDRVRDALSERFLRASLLADLFRINALYMVMQAGSGHLGSTFSSLDIVTWLLTEEMNDPNSMSPNADVYFSSKGHDVPGLYSALIGLGKLEFELIHALRRLNGLPGHPDVGTPFIVTNTGALGMGISKARGMAMADHQEGKKRNLYVLTGDGELQEGAFWESLQPAANGKFAEITAIIDHNKIQSDTWVKEVSDLGNLEEKLRAFGWEVARCSGHDMAALKDVLSKFRKITDRPKVLIADTIKGKGVSFMEKVSDSGDYKFHSGAPSFEHYKNALHELAGRVNHELAKLGIKSLALDSAPLIPRTVPKAPERLISAYGDELVKIGGEYPHALVLNADLRVDTGLAQFAKKFPERFIECGIAEQDMVSMAGGLALRDKLPIVHSFACFLSTRANEQIYNNATEKKKIIYTASLAGLLPSGPGHSHQSVRDISAVGAIPGLVLIEPANEEETRAAIRWAVEKNNESSYIRLVSIPLELPYKLPLGHSLKTGEGVVLKSGNDGVIFAYGPVMLSEAMEAAKILEERGKSISVVNFPWLNRVNEEWLHKTVNSFKILFTIDDHYTRMGVGEMIRSALLDKSLCPAVVSFGIGEIPACGQNNEVLKHHRLDAESVAERILKNLA